MPRAKEKRQGRKRRCKAPLGHERSANGEREAPRAKEKVQGTFRAQEKRQGRQLAGWLAGCLAGWLRGPRFTCKQSARAPRFTRN